MFRRRWWWRSSQARRDRPGPPARPASGAGIRHGHWRGGAIRLRFAAGNDQHVERRHDRGDAVHRHRPCDLHGIDRRRRQPLCRRCPRTAKINVFNNTFDPISVSGAFKDPAVPAGFAPYIQNINASCTSPISCGAAGRRRRGVRPERQSPAAHQRPPPELTMGRRDRPDGTPSPGTAEGPRFQMVTALSRDCFVTDGSQVRGWDGRRGSGEAIGRDAFK